MRLAGRITIRDGRVYFAHGSPLWSEPLLLTSLWLIGDADAYPVDEGAPAVWDGTTCVYEIDRRPYGTLRIGGTGGVADLVEEEEIPPPKTRLETRWHDGAWQKRTAKGWR